MTGGVYECVGQTHIKLKKQNLDPRSSSIENVARVCGALIFEDTRLGRPIGSLQKLAPIKTHVSYTKGNSLIGNTSLGRLVGSPQEPFFVKQRDFWKNFLHT